MEKKAKIIATLGPAIYSENKLKKLVDLGVDAFRINFSHNTSGIDKIVSKIRKVEKKNGKKLSLIADLQGIKLRIGTVKNENQQIKYNQRFVFDGKKIPGKSKRVNFPHPKIIKKFRGKGEVLDNLEWDVKSYLSLGGAVHDAAISAWSIKGFYDYIRPISAIRGMAEIGQSTNPKLPRYHPKGIPMI